MSAEDFRPSEVSTQVLGLKSTGLVTGYRLWETFGMSEALCHCGHPEANHTSGGCSTEIPTKDNPKQFVLCQCRQFNAAHEDIRQVAASIVSGENEG